ncbi:MAG: hypothetical protein NTW26_04400 [bacterium]|nr:hypothetical protein [bacterium]
MQTVLVFLTLALAVGATELYWDDGGGYEEWHYNLGVLFNDAVPQGRPGDTDGQPGVVSEFILGCQFSSGQPELYIYSRDDDSPGEILSGPLAYTLDHRAPWWHFILDEPVDVPGEFFAVVRPFGLVGIRLDTTFDWEIRHSWYCDQGDPQWSEYETDLLIRVEWTPQEPVVEAVSWGIIKAESR